jgi:hypothetical protein
MAITQISAAKIAVLRNKSVLGLPDEPNLTAAQMQAKLVGYSLDDSNSLVAEVNRVVTEANTDITALTPIRLDDVVVTAWSVDATYTGFGYRSTIAATGATTDSFADVVFSIEDAESGNYAPVADTGTDVVYIYARAEPSSLTIPRIEVHK